MNINYTGKAEAGVVNQLICIITHLKYVENKMHIYSLRSLRQAVVE